MVDSDVHSAEIDQQMRTKRLQYLPHGRRASQQLDAPLLRSTEIIRHRNNADLRTIFHLDGTRVVPMIARDSVERLQSAWGEGVAIKLVAATLGTTANGVEQMLRDGLIAEAGNDAAFAKTNKIRVDRRSLESFVATMEDKAKPGLGEAFPCTMPHMAAGMGGGLKPWSAWFSALVGGGTSFTIDEGDEPLAQRLRPSAEGADGLRALPCDDLSGRAFRSSMSRGDAVVTLNLHPRDMRKAFAAWPSDEALPLTEIVGLSRRYVALSELAALLSHPVMAVAGLMRRVQVPRTPRGYDRSRPSRWGPVCCCGGARLETTGVAAPPNGPEGQAPSNASSTVA